MVETSIRPPLMPNIAINPDVNTSLNPRQANHLIQLRDVPIMANAFDHSFNENESIKQISPTYFHQVNNPSTNSGQTDCPKETKKQPLLKTPIMSGESREDGFNPQLVINADHPAYNKVKNVYKSNSYHFGIHNSNNMQNTGRNHEYEDGFCSRNAENNGERARSFIRGQGQGRGRENVFKREDGRFGRGFNRGFPVRGRQMACPPFDKERSFHNDGGSFNRDKYRWRRENSKYRIDDNRGQNSKEINDHGENIEIIIPSKQNSVRHQFFPQNQANNLNNPGRSSDNAPLLNTPLLGQTSSSQNVALISKSPLEKFGSGSSRGKLSGALCNTTSASTNHTLLNDKVNKSQSDIHINAGNNFVGLKNESQINNYINTNDSNVVYKDTQDEVNKDSHILSNDDANKSSRDITNEQNSNLS